jgi:hypothetical protein
MSMCFIRESASINHRQVFRRQMSVAPVSPIRGLRRKRPWLTAFCLCLLVVVSSSGCAVKFIGDYDLAIDNGVTDVQQRAEIYFGKLKSEPKTPYDPSFYNDIDARLVVLKTRAELLPQYPIILKEIQELQSQFNTFQQLDQITPRPFPAGILDAAESAVTISVESILRLELALKRGDKNAPSLGTSK